MTDAFTEYLRGLLNEDGLRILDVLLVGGRDVRRLRDQLRRPGRKRGPRRRTDVADGDAVDEDNNDGENDVDEEAQSPPDGEEGREQGADDSEEDSNAAWAALQSGRGANDGNGVGDDALEDELAQFLGTCDESGTKDAMG